MADQAFHIHDASLHVVVANEPDARPLFVAFCRFLKSHCGFVVTKDPRIERDYESLSKSHRYGQRGPLECVMEYYPRGMQVEFFQNVVFDNPNGGKYDFNKRSKMPYMIRLRHTWVMRKITEWLTSRGYKDSTRKQHNPSTDTLAWFNESWDGEYERNRGIHRFRRREDGWPDDSELNHWNRKDANGCVLNHGQDKFVMVKGRAMRCKVYGGINGMWTCVYGPDQDSLRQSGTWEIYDQYPGKGRIFSDDHRRRRAERFLELAVKNSKFLIAHSVHQYLASVG